jgi:hypothetical protein
VIAVFESILLARRSLGGRGLRLGFIGHRKGNKRDGKQGNFLHCGTPSPIIGPKRMAKPLGCTLTFNFCEDIEIMQG